MKRILVGLLFLGVFTQTAWAKDDDEKDFPEFTLPTIAKLGQYYKIKSPITVYGMDEKTGQIDTEKPFIAVRDVELKVLSLNQDYAFVRITEIPVESFKVDPNSIKKEYYLFVEIKEKSSSQNDIDKEKKDYYQIDQFDTSEFLFVKKTVKKNQFRMSQENTDKFMERVELNAKALRNRSISEDGSSKSNAPGGNSTGEPVVDSQTYIVHSSRINLATAKYHYGIFIGALTLPFKYRIGGQSGERPSQISPQLNIGAAGGFSIEAGTLNWTPMAFLGLSAITLSGVNDDARTELGISLGAGATISVPGRNFQIGLFAGKDILSNSNTDWAYNGKWWLSAGIGFSFTQ